MFCLIYSFFLLLVLFCFALFLLFIFHVLSDLSIYLSFGLLPYSSIFVVRIYLSPHFFHIHSSMPFFYTFIHVFFNLFIIYSIYYLFYYSLFILFAFSKIDSPFVSIFPLVWCRGLTSSASLNSMVTNCRFGSEGGHNWDTFALGSKPNMGRAFGLLGCYL